MTDRLDLAPSLRNLGERVVPNPSAFDQLSRRRARIQRNRKVGAIGLAMLVSAIGVVGAVAGLSDREQSPAEPFPVAPTQRVPESWPIVALFDPSDGYISSEAGAAIDDPRVLAHGVVDGEPFTLAAWTLRPGEPCIQFSGPGDNLLGHGQQPRSLTASGSTAFDCSADAHGVPSERDLYEVGFADPSGLIGVTGIVSQRVDRLVVREANGQETAITVFPASTGWNDLRTFLFFPPDGLRGTLVAFDAAGSELATAPVCTYGGDLSCSPSVTQLVPVGA